MALLNARYAKRLLVKSTIVSDTQIVSHLQQSQQQNTHKRSIKKNYLLSMMNFYQQMPQLSINRRNKSSYHKTRSLTKFIFVLEDERIVPKNASCQLC